MMKTTNIEVKAKYDSGKVYFTDMPNLKEESFEFIAKIPDKYVEKKMIIRLNLLGNY